MSRMQIITVLGIIIVSFMITLSSCESQKHYHPGGPYYYTGWVHYKIPFQPVNEINFHEAKVIGRYYEAYFNNDRKIVSFKAYVDNKIVWTDKYFYNSTGMIEYRELTKSTGETQIQYFDKKGRIIQK